MKRSTASWTTAIAASALLALPVGSWAQQTAPSTSPRQQRPGSATSSPADRDAGAHAQDAHKSSANGHLRQAEAALADIPAASLTGTAKTRVAELKRRINTLEQSTGQASATGTARRNAASWSTEVAAVDRILTELLGSASTTGASEPAATGTSGSTATAPKTTTRGKAATSVTLDETSRAKLQEVRTHITAFAASMSGSNPAATTAAPSSDDPSSPASASAAAPAPTGASTSATTATQGATATSGSAASATPATASPSSPSATAAEGTAASAAPAPQQVDADTVKRHLTAARDTLSQLTQLPAAAQLTGDARTQVSQLITNFNELITTNSDWRASYAKVQANLNALVGDQKTDESAAAPATGTAGAVGTSGTTAVDAGIRAKLIELRSHLSEFEKAAGGGGATASTTTSAPAAPAPAAATAAPVPTGTSGRAAEPAATTGTSGTTPASPAASASSASTTASPSPEPTTASTAAEAQTGAASSQAKPAHEGVHGQAPDAHHREMTRHIDAIEAILNGTSAKGTATTGTSGSTTSTNAKTAGAPSLDRAQIEEIRRHLSQLRASMNQGGK